MDGHCGKKNHRCSNVPDKQGGKRGNYCCRYQRNPYTI